MMPNAMDLALKSMMEDAVTQAVSALSEKHGFDLEDALRDLNLNEIKLVRKRGPSAKSEKKGKKASADKPKSKRGTDGYKVFSKEVRAEVKSDLEKAAEEGVKVTPQQVQTELGSRWSALSLEEQAVYKTKATEINSAASSLVASEASSDEDAPKEKAKKEPKEKAKKEPKEKKSKKPTGYRLFADSIRPGIKEKMIADGEKVTGSALFSAQGAEWKKWTDAEKAVWNEKAKSDSDSEGDSSTE